MRHLKNYWLFILVVFSTISLPTIFFTLRDISYLDNYPQLVNHHIRYQFITLTLAIVMLSVYRFSRKTVFIKYFRKGNSELEILPEPYVGIRPKAQEKWSRAGIEWTITFSAVTAIVLFFQLDSNSRPTMDAVVKVFPFVLVFALLNSFTEEVISRLGVIVALKGVLKDRMIAIISGVLFGTVHYFGTPGGWLGVLLAGFLGWFLAKSILETKGIFWAWFIHFIQDVIIMIFLFSTSQ
jgi:membrane protease YdiL (CAAX protease family)